MTKLKKPSIVWILFCIVLFGAFATATAAAAAAAATAEQTLSAELSSPDAAQNDLSNQCPDRCSCLGGFIDCSNLKLKKVPTLPEWIESLDLSNNQLSFDVKSTVALANLTSLKELQLKYNHLQTIPILESLEALKILVLSHNRIKTINPEALLALPQLQQLDLSKNAIKYLLPNTFPVKNSLRILNLNSNQIEILERQSLDHLRYLVELRLNSNRIKSFTQASFEHLKSLRRLELNGNKLTEINGLSFLNLIELKTLKLRGNQIRMLMDGAFHGLASLSALELDNNQITGIARAWLFNLTTLTTLSLSQNRITQIEVEGWEFIHRLVNLDLSRNQLTSINKTTFEGLAKLRDLNLATNPIATIVEGAFNNTPSLETLDLSHNHISSSIEDIHSPFCGLSKLQRLSLAANSIKTINQNALVGLGQLAMLDLSGNNITSIQYNAFERLVSLTDLTLNTSALLCDCNLQWFNRWSQRVAATMSNMRAVCAYPVWLKGRNVHELREDNFTCSDSPKPKLVEELRSLLALRGSNVTLKCTAASSSPLAMVFQWRRDNVEIPSSMYTTVVTGNDQPAAAATTTTTTTTKTADESASTENRTSYASSSLRLINVSQEHAGKYQCIISNNYGVTYSAKNKITVGTYPIFRKIPLNVTVNAGATARLYCAAMGEPRPQIAWQKDGGNDFPAARERRMHVMPTDDVFFITNAKITDTGVYTCAAENPAGLIRANASLVVLEAPTFVKPMENKEVLTGKSSVLECMAAGSPKPILRWLKDGQPIEATERHFFAAEDQLLIIVDTTPTDAGVYECEMRNELGIERGQMTLTVTPVTMGAIVNVDDMMGIVVITIVICAVGTSIIWVVIIYQSKKRGAASRAESILNDSHINMVMIGNNSPLALPLHCGNNSTVNSVTAGYSVASNLNEFCRKAPLETEEEDYCDDRVSCKDSGTGDSAKRSNSEDFIITTVAIANIDDDNDDVDNDNDDTHSNNSFKNYSMVSALSATESASNRMPLIQTKIVHSMIARRHEQAANCADMSDAALYELATMTRRLENGAGSNMADV